MDFQRDLRTSVIQVSPDWVLRKPNFGQKLTKGTKAIMDVHCLSRRDFADWLADTIFGFEGRIVGPDGRPFPVTDTLIDDAFNGDGSFRWLSDFLRLADNPPKQRPQRRVLSRYRIIELALRINKHRDDPSGS